MPTSEILALCVGDTLDAPYRSAFPKTRADLQAAPRGSEMFTVAREALERLAGTVPGYSQILKNPDKFVRSFGIFAYDLQFFQTDPDFFLNRKWSDFRECFNRMLPQLLKAVRKAFGPEKESLSDFEMAGVAIAYNAGRFEPRRGLKQGHFDGKYFYGERLFENLKIAKKALSA